MISSSLDPGRYLLGDVPVTVGRSVVRIGALEIQIVKRAGRRYLRCACGRLAGRLRSTAESWRCWRCLDMLGGL